MTEKLPICSDWRLLGREAGGRLTRSWRPLWLVWGACLLPLIGSKLEVGTKSREAGINDRGLPVLGGLLQRLWFGFLGWLLQRLWVKILFLYNVWPLYVCKFSFSKVTQWKNWHYHPWAFDYSFQISCYFHFCVLPWIQSLSEGSNVAGTAWDKSRKEAWEGRLLYH